MTCITGTPPCPRPCQPLIVSPRMGLVFFDGKHEMLAENFGEPRDAYHMRPDGVRQFGSVMSSLELNEIIGWKLVLGFEDFSLLVNIFIKFSHLEKDGSQRVVH